MFRLLLRADVVHGGVDVSQRGARLEGERLEAGRRIQLLLALAEVRHAGLQVLQGPDRPKVAVQQRLDGRHHGLTGRTTEGKELLHVFQLSVYEDGVPCVERIRVLKKQKRCRRWHDYWMLQLLLATLRQSVASLACLLVVALGV